MCSRLYLYMSLILVVTLLLASFTAWTSSRIVHTIMWSVHIPDATIWFISYVFRYNNFGGPALYVVHSHGLGVYSLGGDLIWSLNTSMTPIVQHILTSNYRTDLILCNNNTVHRLNSSSSQVVWQKVLGSQITTLYSFGDINNDGTWDVLIGDNNGNIYVIDGVSGNTIWFKSLGASPVNGVSFLKISNTLGVVAYAGKGPSRVNVYLQNGSLLWSKSISSGVNLVFWPQVYIATYLDLNSDGYDEIILLTDSAIMALNGRTGDGLWTKPMSVKPYIIWRVSEDLDGDGTYDLIVGTSQGIYVLSSTSGSTIWYLNLGYIFYIDPYFQDLDGNGYSNGVIASSNGLYMVDLKYGDIIWPFYEVQIPVAVQLTWIKGDFNRNQAVIGSHDGKLIMISFETASQISLVTYTETRTLTVTYTYTETTTVPMTRTETLFTWITETTTVPMTRTETRIMPVTMTVTREGLTTPATLMVEVSEQVSPQTYLIAFTMIALSTVVALLIRKR